MQQPVCPSPPGTSSTPFLPDITPEPGAPAGGSLVQFREGDNVAVALADLEPGQSYPLLTYQGAQRCMVTVAASQPAWLAELPGGPQRIRRFFKVAVAPIALNDAIVKDDVPIGVASEPIAAGQVVHQCIRDEGGRMVRRAGNIAEYPNLFNPPADEMRTLAQSYAILRAGLNAPPELRPPDHAPAAEHFLGYLRPAGPPGVRNHVLVVPSVFCVNQEAREIAEAFRATAWGAQGENRVHALTHQAGCCQVGFDEETTLRLLSGVAAHPNVAGVVVVALGCSPLCVDDRLYQAIAARHAAPDRVRLVRVQGSGRSAALRAGREHVAQLVAAAQDETRQPAPVSDLLLAVKCGGSDPTSGLFSNTTIGHVADWLLDRGGTVMISEIMEYFGAEKVLRERCRDYAIWLRLLRFIKTNEMIGKAAAVAAERDLHSVELTVGNIAAGLSTQEEKSLGAIRKMGFRHPIEQVLRTGDSPAGARHGLYVVDGPGQDLLSASALSAAGAQLMLFSTGIGTPLGSAVTPVLKITGNRETAARHADFIDRYVPFQELIAAGRTAAQIAVETLLPNLLATAEGRPTRAEINGHCDFDLRSMAMVQ